MTRHSDPKAGAAGKVIPFPLVARPSAAPPLVVQPRSERPAPRRIRRWDQWGVHLWLFCSWLVAFDHLRGAVARHEVFGALDSLSFLVAAVMPIMRIRALLEWFSRAPRKRRGSHTGAADTSRSA